MSNCKWITNIKSKVHTRVPELKENQDLCESLIDDAFTQIILHTNATAYRKEWDNILVNCVVILYNYLGVEGSKSRSANGVSDTYDSSVILAPTLASKLPYFIKPVGYVFPETRFNMPD
jgi:hypothetical protein